MADTLHSLAVTAAEFIDEVEDHYGPDAKITGIVMIIEVKRGSGKRTWHATYPDNPKRAQRIMDEGYELVTNDEGLT